jgi:hypothetical protein
MVFKATFFALIRHLKLIKSGVFFHHCWTFNDILIVTMFGIVKACSELPVCIALGNFHIL